MEKKRRKARGLYSSCIILLSKVSIALFLVQIIALGVLARAEGKISSVGQERDITSLTLLFWACFSIFTRLLGFYWDSLLQETLCKKASNP